jgi:hypothetical protein
MKLTIVVAALWPALLGGLAMSAQDVGLAFSEFEGSGRQ